MPFSFRGCLGDNLERQIYNRGFIGCSSNDSTNAANHECQADGQLEYKLVSGKYFKKQEWTTRHCVLNNETLYIYEDETRQIQVFSVCLRAIVGFSSNYRIGRQAEVLGNEWGTAACMFSFYSKQGVIVKLRAIGEEDSNYWMTNFRNFLTKPYSGGSGSHDPRAYSSMEQASQKNAANYNSQSTSSQPPQRPPNEGNVKLASALCSPKQPNACSTPNSKLLPAGPTQEERDLRRQLTAEFIDALRRTDTMLEGRQAALRSQLQERDSSDTTTMSPMKAVMITDHEEEISQFSISTSYASTFKAATIDRSRLIRPSSFSVRRKPTLASSSSDDGTLTTSAAILETDSRVLPTVVDDRYQRSSRPLFKDEHALERRLGNVQGTGASQCSDTLFTSSLVIQLNPRRYNQSSVQPPTLSSPVIKSALTIPQNSTTYSVSSSNASVTCAFGDQVATKLPQQQRKEPEPVVEAAKTPFPTLPPKPPQLPQLNGSSAKDQKPKEFSKSKSTLSTKSTPAGPSLSSSFLSELRAAALKRQKQMRDC